MEKRSQIRTLLLLGLAAVVAFILVRVSGRQPVAKISATRPAQQNIVSSITSNGTVEPIAPYTVQARLDTFVEKVLASEGQNVKKGQLILRLDVKDVTSQLAAARARLLRAQDDLRAAQAGGRADEAARVNEDLAKALAERDRQQKNHDALQRLLAQGAATNEEVRANDLELAKAVAEVKKLTAAKQEFTRTVNLDLSRATLALQQAQSDVAALEEKVRQGSITAPVDGTLYSLPAREGKFVRVGDLLAEMADLKKVRVRAFIDEPDLGGLEPGLPVKITWDALPNSSWQGKTEIVPKQVVPHQSRSVGELLCSVDNDKLQLLPNTNVNVRIHSRERLHVITVPRGAVDTEGGKRFVFVVVSGVSNSKLEKREIEVGIADATSFEVVRGLQGTEVLALPGDVDLKNGLVVRVVSMDTTNFKDGSDEGL
ncbi:MAG TPA: efflux RND transporter periplasmic adaptor subunit [Candidatus Limnocylindrales bacterium]|nr:efflux RND transporter periplasmic adaptor subunit [Candidatus Limnocylindrales bacterium]